MKKFLIAGALSVFAVTNAFAMDKPFGGEKDVAYAKELWDMMSAVALVGPNMTQTHAYEGGAPHGAILTTAQRKLTMGDHTGDIIVKHNYGGEGIDEDEVMEDPAKWLKAVTVMYRREEGYDADNADWFWVKYAADGSIDTNPKGAMLAGRVAKGADVGCIACHSGAGGDDYVFTHDQFAN